MKDYNDDDRTPVVPAAPRKVHQFYFVKFYQKKDLNEEATILRQREIDDQIRETQRHFDDTLRRKQDLSYYKRSTQEQAGYRLKYSDERKSVLEYELRSLRGTLKLMSLKSLYRAIHHGTNNLVGEKKTIKKIKLELEEEIIAEKERISEKEKVYRHRSYMLNPEPSYSLIELKEKIKFKEMQMDRLRTSDHKDRGVMRTAKLDMDKMEKDLVSIEKKLIQLKEQKAELDAPVLQMQKHNENMIYVRTLVERKDVQGVKELSRKLVRKFMSQWNKNSEFRKDYVKRNLASLERRQLTADGLSKMSARYFYAEKRNQQHMWN